MISRRAFLERSTALGVGASMAVLLANAGTVGAASGFRNGFATYPGQEGTPSASPVPEGMGRPEVGTEGQERGSGGELRIIQTQAPTALSPHIATGSKDLLAASIVVEPLIHYLPDATLAANLLTDVPSVENGLLAEDLSSVTLELLPDLVWSDGEPVTAEDIKFTVEWVQDPDNNSVNQDTYEVIDRVEVVDGRTAIAHFTGTNPFWFDPFAGTNTGYLYPKHILEGGEEAANAYLSNPIGTGPYIVESFEPNDQVTYAINENYREPNKPFFERVLLKGGGDAASAARAVVQTGDYHYGWGVTLEPDVMEAMSSDDNPGEFWFDYEISVTVEAVYLNFSDPDTEVDGQRSEVNTPHPFFTDDAVREAVNLAIDRDLIVTSFYGKDQEPAVNVVHGDEPVQSKNTSWEFNPEKASEILDEAGWVLEGDVRKKDGVELRAVFTSSVNQIRQKSQAVIKQNLEDIGFKVELVSVDPAIFFDASAGNDQNTQHFYSDMTMFQEVPNNPRSMSYMAGWYAGPDNRNVPQKANNWTGSNVQRWVNADYDAVYDQARVETDADRLAELFVEMNDLVITNHVVMPLVRVSPPRGISRQLRKENVGRAAFSFDYWNIANWNFSTEDEE